MPGRNNVMSQNSNDFRLHYKTFTEYYWVEGLQNCFWLNESKLLRTLGKIPLQICGRTYIYQCQVVLMWFHKIATILVCITRLWQSTTGSRAFKDVVGSTNRNCCVPWVKWFPFFIQPVNSEHSMRWWGTKKTFPVNFSGVAILPHIGVSSVWMNLKGRKAIVSPFSDWIHENGKLFQLLGWFEVFRCFEEKRRRSWSSEVKLDGAV